MTFITIFDIVADYLPKQRPSELGAFERVMMTLMRLMLNMPVKCLAYRFKTYASTVSRTFITVIHVMYVRLKHLIYWPQREELCLTMPLEFRQQFAQKMAVIIDCFEVFIQRPKNQNFGVIESVTSILRSIVGFWENYFLVIWY